MEFENKFVNLADDEEMKAVKTKMANEYVPDSVDPKLQAVYENRLKYRNNYAVAKRACGFSWNIEEMAAAMAVDSHLREKIEQDEDYFVPPYDPEIPGSKTFYTDLDDGRS